MVDGDRFFISVINPTVEVQLSPIRRCTFDVGPTGRFARFNPNPTIQRAWKVNVHAGIRDNDDDSKDFVLFRFRRRDINHIRNGLFVFGHVGLVRDFVVVVVVVTVVDIVIVIVVMALTLGIDAFAVVNC
jgi:hypothetical protein